VHPSPLSEKKFPLRSLAVFTPGPFPFNQGHQNVELLTQVCEELAACRGQSVVLARGSLNGLHPLRADQAIPIQSSQNRIDSSFLQRYRSVFGKNSDEGITVVAFMVESPHDCYLQDSLLELRNAPIFFFVPVSHNAEYTIMLGTGLQRIVIVWTVIVPATVQFPQFRLEKFACPRSRNFIREYELLWKPPLWESRRQVSSQGFRRRSGTGLAHHNSQRALQPLRIGDRNDG